MDGGEVGVESLGSWEIGVVVRGIRLTAPAERIRKQRKKKDFRSNIVVMMDVGCPS